MPIRAAHLSTMCISRDEAKKVQPETAAIDNRWGQHVILLPRAVCQAITKKSQQCTEMLFCIESGRNLLNSKL